MYKLITDGITRKVNSKEKYFKIQFYVCKTADDLRALLKDKPDVVLKAFRRGAPLVASNEIIGKTAIDDKKLLQLLQKGVPATEAVKQAKTQKLANEISKAEYEKLIQASKEQIKAYFSK